MHGTTIFLRSLTFSFSNDLHGIRLGTQTCVFITRLRERAQESFKTSVAVFRSSQSLRGATGSHKYTCIPSTTEFNVKGHLKVIYFGSVKSHRKTILLQ